MKYFGGVDPGKKGAIVIIDEDRIVVDHDDMPDTDTTLFLLLQDLKRAWNPTTFIERVWGNPGWGGRQCFEFGRQKGRAEMGLEAAGFRFASVPPTVWQKFFELFKTPEERRKGGQVKWKKRLCRFAEDLFDCSIPLQQAEVFHFE